MKKYTEKDLVKFGNYLLSEERSKSILNKDNLDKVHNEDISNVFDVEEDTELDKQLNEIVDA